MEKRMTPQARYEAANIRRVALNLNRKTDADILAKLTEVDNMQGYLKRLVREDLAREKGNEIGNGSGKAAETQGGSRL